MYRLVCVQSVVSGGGALAAQRSSWCMMWGPRLCSDLFHTCTCLTGLHSQHPGLLPFPFKLRSHFLLFEWWGVFSLPARQVWPLVFITTCFFWRLKLSPVNFLWCHHTQVSSVCQWAKPVFPVSWCIFNICLSVCPLSLSLSVTLSHALPLFTQMGWWARFLQRPCSPDYRQRAAKQRQNQRLVQTCKTTHARTHTVWGVKCWNTQHVFVYKHHPGLNGILHCVLDYNKLSPR